MDPSSCQKCCVATENGDYMDTSAEGQCLHDLKCLNCISNAIEDYHHPADARRCPIRLQKYGTARENERRAMKADNPWLKVKHKKAKPKMTNTQQKATTNPRSTNRFTALAPPNPQHLAPAPVPMST